MSNGIVLPRHRKMLAEQGFSASTGNPSETSERLREIANRKRIVHLPPDAEDALRAAAELIDRLSK